MKILEVTKEALLTMNPKLKLVLIEGVFPPYLNMRFGKETWECKIDIDKFNLVLNTDFHWLVVKLEEFIKNVDIERDIYVINYLDGPCLKNVLHLKGTKRETITASNANVSL